MAEATEVKAPAFTARMELSRDVLSSALCSALEGGIGYWGHVSRRHTPTAWVYNSDDAYTKETGRYWPFDYPLNPGGSLTIYDDEEQKGGYKLDAAALQKALDILAEKYPWHLANIVAENSDAETGDVLVQCAIFGDIVYG